MSDIEMEDGLPYDPDQNPEEKRVLRKEFRSLGKKFEGDAKFSHDDISKALTRQDALFDKVKTTQEATLDSELLLRLTTLSNQKAREMKSGSGAFDIEDFVSRLVTFMGGRKLDNQNLDEDGEDEDVYDLHTPLEWHKIGRNALAKSRRVPVVGFMLGPLSIEQKTRAPVKREKLEKNKAEQTKPQELKEEDISRSTNETTKNVATLEGILSETGPINLFKFIVNPEDFAQSVENLFYLSFLIRDGKVALETSEDTGEPIIYACNQPEPQDYIDGLKKRQIVFEFDQATWKRAIEVFDITQPVIPQRTQTGMRIGNKWYG
ncbi:hypothetical protein VKT23_000867 [Stygiomarasmius scandens]|uniref:Non-structural maintenance of chromosomes element 4 n=1 Tax=Marasmiellus scandens TaxID=2682957 RepID=A0ABR1K975_9AGAR